MMIQMRVMDLVICLVPLGLGPLLSFYSFYNEKKSQKIRASFSPSCRAQGVANESLPLLGARVFGEKGK